jgi:Domain of unknown function (DUF397)
MSSTESGPHPIIWRKAHRSMGNGECVEVAPTVGTVLVRDSKLPDTYILAYPPPAWQSFLSRAKRGDFDVLRSLSSL